MGGAVWCLLLGTATSGGRASRAVEHVPRLWEEECQGENRLSPPWAWADLLGAGAGAVDAQEWCPAQEEPAHQIQVVQEERSLSFLLCKVRLGHGEALSVLKEALGCPITSHRWCRCRRPPPPPCQAPNQTAPTGLG